MIAELIWAGIFFGILIGALIGFLWYLHKNKLVRKNASKKIKEQNLRFIIDGKPVDMSGKVDKELMKKIKEEKEIQEKKLKNKKEEKKQWEQKNLKKKMKKNLKKNLKKKKTS